MTVISQHAFGIVCPRCRGREARVLSKSDGKGYIRRRHACLNPECQMRNIRWTTYSFMSVARARLTDRKLSAISATLL